MEFPLPSEYKPSKIKDLYERLRLERDASFRDIDLEYFLLRRFWNDNTKPQHEIKIETAALDEAHRILSDPISRGEYDHERYVKDSFLVETPGKKLKQLSKFEGLNAKPPSGVPSSSAFNPRYGPYSRELYQLVITTHIRGDDIREAYKVAAQHGDVDGLSLITNKAIDILRGDPNNIHVADGLVNLTQDPRIFEQAPTFDKLLELARKRA